MKTNRVLLAVRPTLLREALADAVESQTDAVVVGQTEDTDPISLLMAVGRTDANILIHAESTNEMFAGGYTHLFAEFAGLVIVRIDPERNTACTFRQMIRTELLPSSELHDVIDSIRPLVAAA